MTGLNRIIAGLPHRVMEDDIEAFKGAGADGVVFGILEKDGRVDLHRTER